MASFYHPHSLTPYRRSSLLSEMQDRVAASAACFSQSPVIQLMVNTGKRPLVFTPLLTPQSHGLIPVSALQMLLFRRNIADKRRNRTSLQPAWNELLILRSSFR
jgi:hypothetical protein